MTALHIGLAAKRVPNHEHIEQAKSILASPGADPRAKSAAHEVLQLAGVDVPAPATRAPPPPWAARVVTAPADWFAKPPKARTWLLADRRPAQHEGVLPLGKVGMLVSEGGGGKTQAIAQLAVAVANGGAWLGSLQVTSPGRVLLILGEEDADELHRRLYRAARSMSAPTPPEGSISALPLSGLPSALVQRDERGNTEAAPFFEWLRTYLAAGEEWKLIVLDPLSRFAGLDAEKDNAHATRFIEAAESLANQTGATVLVAHHTNKVARVAGASVTSASSRGSSAFTDGARWVGTLAAEALPPMGTGGRLDELVTFTVTKSNYAKKPDAILLRRDPDHGGALVPLDDVDLSIIEDARRSVDPRSRRRSERDAEQAAAEARRDEKRSAQARERDEEEARRKAREDAALLEVLRVRPGIGSRELRAALKAELGGCRAHAADEASARLRKLDLVRVEPGPNRSSRHFLNDPTDSSTGDLATMPMRLSATAVCGVSRSRNPPTPPVSGHTVPDTPGGVSRVTCPGHTDTPDTRDTPEEGSAGEAGGGLGPGGGDAPGSGAVEHDGGIFGDLLGDGGRS